MEQRYEPETDPSSIVGQDLPDDTHAGAVMAHVSRGDHVVCVSGAYGWSRPRRCVDRCAHRGQLGRIRKPGVSRDRQGTLDKRGAG